ncbi:MAG: cytochrome c biogenesis protein CcsA, partial [Pseudolysinimonas sp.]
MTETLAAYSLVAIYSAIAVYALAFIAFVLDLSKRAAVSQAIVAEPAVASARARVGSTMVAERGSTGSAVSTGSTTGGASRYQRVAFALTGLAWVIHVASIVVRGVAAGHVPWSNMFEFASMGTAFMVAVFLAVQLWRDVKFVGAFVTGLVALLLGLASVNFYVPITPLPPALQSVWLVVHVFVATLASGFFAVGGGLSIAQLLQSRREAGKAEGPRFLRTFPSSEKLEFIANRLIIVGFALWTFTLMAGAIWAERAWGRYWGWDTKEVWTFIIWV